MFSDVVDCSLMFSDVLDCSLMFSDVLLTVIIFSGCKRWVALHVIGLFYLSSFKPSFLFFYIFLFILFWAIQPIHYTHIHTNPINYLLPCRLAASKKNFFLNIRGRQVAGGELWSSRVRVCVLCVCVLVVLFHFLCFSLHSLSTHCHYQFITTLSFFPCRSSTGEKGELSLHPFITSHPVFSYPVVILLFFSLYVLNLWTDWTLGNSLSSLSYNCWIGDLH